jgi:hypothetical protein
VLHDCAKSRENGCGPPAPPSKFLNVRPPTSTGERAVERRVGRPVGDGEDVAGRGLDGHERGLGRAVAERGLGRLLDVAVERRAQRAPGRATERAQRAVGRTVGEADDDPPGRRAGELLLVAGL